MATYQYYLGQTFDNLITAVYRATFEGRRLTSEERWGLPNGTSWGYTRDVSEWYYIGNDLVEEISQETAELYLGAL